MGDLSLSQQPEQDCPVQSPLRLARLVKSKFQYMQPVPVHATWRILESLYFAKINPSNFIKSTYPLSLVN